MSEIRTEAVSVAAFITTLKALPHETRAIVTATENGVPWAHVEMSPLTNTQRSAFPVDSRGQLGDDRLRSNCGVIVPRVAADHALSVVINRAHRMHLQEMRARSAEWAKISAETDTLGAEDASDLVS